MKLRWKKDTSRATYGDIDAFDAVEKNGKFTYLGTDDMETAQRVIESMIRLQGDQ